MREVWRNCSGSGMTGRIRLNVLEDFGKASADNIGDFGHEVGHFFPFFRKQVLFQLRMDRPLRIDLSPLSTYEDAQKFHVPCRFVAWAFTCRVAAHWA